MIYMVLPEHKVTKTPVILIPSGINHLGDLPIFRTDPYILYRHLMMKHNKR